MWNGKLHRHNSNEDASKLVQIITGQNPAELVKTELQASTPTAEEIIEQQKQVIREMSAMIECGCQKCHDCAAHKFLATNPIVQEALKGWRESWKR